MLTGSLILRVASPFVHWLDGSLKAGKHYISVADDLSDLEEKVAWCLEHDSKCKKIAENGRLFAEKALKLPLLKKYMETEFKRITG
jgi:hypothetical protein